MRVKRGFKARRRRKKVLKLAKGFRGGRSKLFRTAADAVDKALMYSYRDRRTSKRDFRRLWITRINAAARGRTAGKPAVSLAPAPANPAITTTTASASFHQPAPPFFGGAVSSFLTSSGSTVPSFVPTPPGVDHDGEKGGRRSSGPRYRIGDQAPDSTGFFSWKLHSIQLPS